MIAKKNYCFILVFSLFIGLTPSLFAQQWANFDMATYTKVFSIEKARMPEYWNNRVIFTFQAQRPIRYVAIAFRHEDYAIRHPFMVKYGDGTLDSKNQDPLYFFLYNVLEKGPETLEYRLIVDGRWQHDPNNPQQTQDNFGNQISYYELPQDRSRLIDSPVIEKDGTISFYYRGRPGDNVSLVGSFNRWDPFMHRFQEDQNDPGLFKLNLYLPPGEIYYHFMVGIEKVLDELNPKKAFDRSGSPLSYFYNSGPSLVREQRF